MSYIDKTLVPGEKVVYTTRLHWIVMLGHIFGACVLWAIGRSANVAGLTP